MAPTQFHAEELDQLQEISAAVNRITDLDTLYWSMIDWIENMTGVPDCVIYVKIGNVLTQVAALGIKRGKENTLNSRMGLSLGAGVVGTAAFAGQSLYVADTSQDSRYIYDEYSGRSEYCSVLVHRGQVVGAIDTEHPDVDGISEKTRQILEAIAVLSAPHLSALLHSGNQPDLGEVIADLAHLPPSGDLRTTFANITERASKTLHVSRANIWVFNDDSSTLECIDQFDLASDQHSLGARLEQTAYPAYFEALQGERVIIAHDAANDPRTCEFDDGYLATNNIKSMLDAPMLQDGQVVGVICLEQSDAERQWTQDEASFVATLADLATIAYVSERRAKAETALIQAQKMESLGRLAGGIAHDFNNLLTVISGAVETLQVKTKLDESAQRLTKLVMDASVRASRLTRNLLAFGGNQPLELRSLNAAELSTNIQSLVGELIREDIDLIFHPASNEVWSNADNAQLEQVLLNLILNAVDALPRGGQIDVRFSTAEQSDFEVSVSDNGVGIDENVHQRIFEPFFTTKGEQGSGLGLSVCQGIVRQHGGTLICTSTPFEGSTFRFSIPRITPSSSATEPEIAPTLKHGATQPMRILLVEDESGVRTVVTQMLQALGFDTRVALDAKEALDVLNGGDIDLLLTDVVMPDMRGPEIYQIAITQNKGLRALFVSGYTDDVLTEIPMSDDRVGYLPKPFTLAELQAAIIELSDRH